MSFFLFFSHFSRLLLIYLFLLETLNSFLHFFQNILKELRCRALLWSFQSHLFILFLNPHSNLSHRPLFPFTFLIFTAKSLYFFRKIHFLLCNAIAFGQTILKCLLNPFGKKLFILLLHDLQIFLLWLNLLFKFLLGWETFFIEFCYVYSACNFLYIFSFLWLMYNLGALPIIMAVQYWIHLYQSVASFKLLVFQLILLEKSADHFRQELLGSNFFHSGKMVFQISLVLEFILVIGFNILQFFVKLLSAMFMSYFSLRNTWLHLKFLTVLVFFLAVFLLGNCPFVDNILVFNQFNV